MKRIYISICFVAALTMASIAHASPVNVTDARQVADVNTLIDIILAG